MFDFENVKTVIHLVLQELSEWNAWYWKKFGFIFLICAFGRTAFKILAELKVNFETLWVFKLNMPYYEPLSLTKMHNAAVVCGKLNY